MGIHNLGVFKAPAPTHTSMKERGEERKKVEKDKGKRGGEEMRDEREGRKGEMKGRGKRVRSTHR